MYQKRRTLEQFFLIVLDTVSMLLALATAFQIKYGHVVGIEENWDQQWMLGYMVIIVVVVDLWRTFDKRFFRRGYLDELWSCCKKQFVFSCGWLLISFVSHRIAGLSRLVFGYYLLFGILFMFLIHLIYKMVMIHVVQKSRISNNMLLICAKERAEEVIRVILAYHEWNRRLIGVAIVDDPEKSCDEIQGVPVVSYGDDLMDYVTKHEIDEIFIMDYENRNQDVLMDEYLPQLVNMGVTVNINISDFDRALPCKKSMNRVGKYATVTMARNEFSTTQLILKRGLDIIGSLVGMVILAVATIFVAPAIKLESPGPVFFGQIRVGKNGRKFKFYKFRSMYQDAEERKKELMEQNEVKGLMFKMEDDPRITKVGKFLRRTSIDELPQFWNVLKGDMSLVGTRPPTMDEFVQYEAKYKCRLSMTPGITGLWQVSGRSEIKDFDEVVSLDMQYIDDWTILKDIQILCKTVVVVFLRKGSK